MSKISLLCIALFVSTLSGCGAIINGSRQNISATSTPDGATVTGSGTQYTTPAILSLERKSPHVLVFSKTGYSQGQFAVNNSINAGIVVMDVLFTGLIGVVVDAVTGSWFKLVPESATVTLTKVDASVAGPDTIHIAIRQDAESSQNATVRFEADGPGVTVRALRVR
jgi:hypothetical protein